MNLIRCLQHHATPVANNEKPLVERYHSTKRIHLIYDERMTLHRPVVEDPEVYTYENHDRIIKIYERLKDLDERLRRRNSDDDDGSDRGKERALSMSDEDEDEEKHFKREDAKDNVSSSIFLPLSCEPASRDVIGLVHDAAYYDALKRTSEEGFDFADRESYDVAYDDDDIYVCADTFQAALLACGGVVRCVDAAVAAEGGSRRAVAVVRPPGHHACANLASGFCFFNSVAVAAVHAVHSRLARRVLVLDWDCHHGNGTQDLTLDDPHVFYVSLHRASNGSTSYFYPGTGLPNEVGAAGTNLNVAWTHEGMGDVEYAAAFVELILPVVAAYAPDLVIVSCGFDAVRGDPIGDCDLSPSSFHAMTRALLLTAGVDVPFVVALEGGYDHDANAACMEAVTTALLDRPYVGDDGGDNNEGDDATWTSATTTSKERDDGRCGGDREEMLFRGRRVFSRLWDREAADRHERGRARRVAVKAVNKSIRAIRRSPIWKGSRVRLKEIPEQNTDEPSPKRMMTRSRTGRLRMKKLEGALKHLRI